MLTCRQPKEGRYGVNLYRMSKQGFEDIDAYDFNSGFAGELLPLEDVCCDQILKLFVANVINIYIIDSNKQNISILI